MKGYTISARGVEKLRTLLRNASPGVSTGTPYAPAALSIDENPAPFAVRWASSAASGAGAWIVWLPNTSLCIVNGAAVNFLSALTPVGGKYKSGWYVAPLSAENGGTLYLVVTITKTSSGGFTTYTATAALATTPGTAGANQQVYNLVVAEASRDATEKVAHVRQGLTSAVALSGGGDGGSTPWPTPTTGGTLTFVTDVWYDLSYHRLMKKTQTFRVGIYNQQGELIDGNGLITAISAETSPVMITGGQAVPIENGGT